MEGEKGRKGRGAEGREKRWKQERTEGKKVSRNEEGKELALYELGNTLF